jgi:myo-inositol 2-dehydrogenase/D-chiro-inositol 1-dehydrogenase
MHVLCEKPLASTTTQAWSLFALSKRPEHVSKKIITVYCRRFDPSYAHTLSSFRTGKIGPPIVIHAENCDRRDHSSLQLQLLLSNPGIFIDAGIHDINLSLVVLGVGGRPSHALPYGRWRDTRS